MMEALLPAMHDAFELAAGELGMLSAARIFLREAERTGGRGAIAELREALGAAFPVLDAVATRAAAGGAIAKPDLDELASALQGSKRLLFVGLEVELLEPLVNRLRATEPTLRVGVVLDPNLRHDDARVAANFTGPDLADVAVVPLADFQRFAGQRSALVTPIYGTDGFRATVSSAWVRVFGPDARTQFRTLLGCDLLGEPLREYPRWLCETSTADFTAICGPASQLPRRAEP